MLSVTDSAQAESRSTQSLSPPLLSPGGVNDSAPLLGWVSAVPTRSPLTGSTHWAVTVPLNRPRSTVTSLDVGM